MTTPTRYALTVLLILVSPVIAVLAVLFILESIVLTIAALVIAALFNTDTN